MLSLLTSSLLATSLVDSPLVENPPDAKPEMVGAKCNVIDAKLEVVDDTHELIPAEPGEEALTGAMLYSETNRYAPRRSKWQREVDLLDISEFLLKRVTITEITRRVNHRLVSNQAPYTLSSNQVRNDAKEINRRWTDEFVGGTARMRKAAELAFLDRIEREAWDVYSRTLRDDQSGSQITSGMAAEVTNGATGRSVNVTKTVAKAQRDGEVGPLLLLLKISEHRAKLLGFHAVADLVSETADATKQLRFEAIRKAFAAKILRDHDAKQREEKMLAAADAEAHAQPSVLQPG